MNVLLSKILHIFSKKNRESVFTQDHFKNYKNVKIGDYTYGIPKIYSWDNSTRLEVGKFCSIADNVKILMGGNHRIDWLSTYPFNVLNEKFPLGNRVKGHPISKGDIKIGNDVWIGNDVIILSGVTIGDGVVVAAGSIVTKSIAPYCIVGGNPARMIKQRFSDDEIVELLKIRWWEWPVEKINENIPLICSENIQTFISNHKIN